jgi:hypothetical protein
MRRLSILWPVALVMLVPELLRPTRSSLTVGPTEDWLAIALEGPLTPS